MDLYFAFAKFAPFAWEIRVVDPLTATSLRKTVAGLRLITAAVDTG